MRLGLQIPQGYFNEFEGWEPARAIRRVIEVCQLAERRGFDAVSLGTRILRSESAVLAALAIAQYEWGELG